MGVIHTLGLDGVELVLMDIVGHAGVENRLGIGCGMTAECGADSGCGDVFGEIGENVKRRLMTGGVAEGKQLCAGGGGGLFDCGDAFRKNSSGMEEIKAGACADNESAGHQEFCGAIPGSDGKPGISAEKAEELVVRCERAFEMKHAFDGVVGAVIRKRSIEPGDLDAGIAGESECGHGDAVLEAGGGRIVLKGLQTDGCDQHAIEVEAVDGEAGERNVSAMRRVETAAE
jgi:hypothetical protein